MLRSLFPCLMGTLLIAGPALAETLDLTQSGVVSPTFRGQAQTTYLGWDFLEAGGDPLGFGQVLDDATPDVGTYAGSDARLKQDDGLAYGHRSGSGNYYSGFGLTDIAADTITIPTAGTVGSAGYTTLIVQILGSGGSQPGGGSGGNPIADLIFDSVNGVDPTIYYALDQSGANNGSGHYLVVYELAGNQAIYDVHFSSVTESRAIELFMIDTIYSINAGAFSDAVLVPEPATLALLMFGATAAMARRRRRND